MIKKKKKSAAPSTLEVEAPRAPSFETPKPSAQDDGGDFFATSGDFFSASTPNTSGKYAAASSVRNDRSGSYGFAADQSEHVDMDSLFDTKVSTAQPNSQSGTSSGDLFDLMSVAEPVQVTVAAKNTGASNTGVESFLLDNLGKLTLDKNAPKAPVAKTKSNKPTLNQKSGSGSMFGGAKTSFQPTRPQEQGQHPAPVDAYGFPMSGGSSGFGSMPQTSSRQGTSDPFTNLMSF